MDAIKQQPAAHQAEKPDPIASLLDQFRDEQLCSFVAEMGAIRHMQGPSNYQPIMVSRSAAEAIEEFLVAHGFGAHGRRKDIAA